MQVKRLVVGTMTERRIPMSFGYRNNLPLCDKSGVYAIVNLVTDKIYIGSALVIRARLFAHRSILRRGVHDNSYLQRAWNKFPEKFWLFKVVEVCIPKRLMKREQYYLDTLGVTARGKGYNLV